MSTNCVRCIKNKRTGFDLLCDSCRIDPHCYECEKEKLSYKEEDLYQAMNDLRPLGE